MQEIILILITAARDDQMFCQPYNIFNSTAF